MKIFTITFPFLLGADAFAHRMLNDASYNVQSVCAGGSAYACMDWNAGSFAMTSAASDYAARTGEPVPIFGVGSVGHTDTKYNMGKCFKFTLETTSQPIIFQAINEGGDVMSGNVDLQMAAGGEGAFLGCTNPSGGGTPMFAGVGDYPSVFGEHPFSGGPSTKDQCQLLPEFPSALPDNDVPPGAVSLIEECERSFDLKLRKPPGNGDTNPRILTRSWIPCPDELVELTGLKRTDDPAQAIDQASDISDSSHMTRMMDCCKPSAGWIGNVYNYDANFPAVMACQADGFTRLDGSRPRVYSSSSCVVCPAVTVIPACDDGCNECTITPQTCSQCPTATCQDQTGPSNDPTTQAPTGGGDSGSGCCTWDANQGCQTTARDWCGVNQERCTSCGGSWMGADATDEPTPTTTTTTTTPATTSSTGEISGDDNQSGTSCTDSLSVTSQCWNTGCTVQVSTSQWNPRQRVLVRFADKGVTITNAWNAEVNSSPYLESLSNHGEAVGLLELASYHSNGFGFNMAGSNKQPEVTCL